MWINNGHHREEQLDLVEGGTQKILLKLDFKRGFNGQMDALFVQPMILCILNYDSEIFYCESDTEVSSC